jgi:hypothetical protein
VATRWTSSHSNARLEGLNGLFHAARARARGYRSVTTFATIIYLIAAPAGGSGLDVHQKTVVACVLTGAPGCRPTKQVRTFRTITRDP